MKKLFLLIIFSSSIFNSQFSICQTWKEMMDSADYYKEKQDFPTSLKWAKLALPQVEKEYGKNDTNYVAALAKMVEIFYNKGQLDSVVRYQENILSLCRAIYKVDHPKLAESIINMALFYKSIGNYEKAEPLYKESIEMMRRLYKGDNADLATTIDNYGLFYVDRGNFGEAGPLCKEGLEMYRRLYKGDHPELASSICNMAYFYKRSGNYDEAVPLYEEALDMRRRLFKGDNPNLATNLNNIANIYHEQGKYDEAEPLFKESLNMQRRLFKGDNTNLAITMGNLANIYGKRGNYKEAEPLLKEALEMQRRLFNGDQPGMAVNISNLASIYDEMGNFKEAEPLFLEALGMFRRLFKGDHPYLASSINNMAYFYNKIGNYREAEPLYKEALEMRKRRFKGDSPNLAMGMNNLATFYYTLGNYKEAEPLLKGALEMLRRIFKNDHPNLASLINNMAGFYNNIGYYTEAEPLYKEALEMRRRLFKGDNHDLASSISNLASFYNERGNYIEAEPLNKDALEMFRRIFKGDNPDLARSMNNLACFYDENGNYKEAELLFKESLDMKRRIFKEDHPDLALGIGNMATFYSDRGNYKEAEPLIKEALEMRRRLYKEDHPDLAISINNLAMLYNTTGIYDEAEPLFIEALEMYKRILKGDHPELAIIMNNAAKSYENMGSYAKAETLYKESLSMAERLFKDDHRVLASSLMGLANFYLQHDKADEAKPLLDRVYDMTLKRVREYFPYLDEQQKVDFWGNNMELRMNEYYKFGIKYYDQKPEIAEKLADITLATKGIVLNSTQKALSKARFMRRTLDDWQNTRQFWLRLVQNPQKAKEMRINIDSVEKAASLLEKEISGQSLDFKKAFDTSLVRWKDVQGTLRQNEACVEIVRVKGNNDSVSYSALITKKDSRIPELVVLTNGNELEEDYIRKYANLVEKQRHGLKLTKLDLDELGRLYLKYWKPIQSKLLGINTVYVSMDGVYNEFNPNTLLNPVTGQYVLEEIDLRIVTSTRDLAKINLSLNPPPKGDNRAKLFGAPQFELKKEVNLPPPDTTGLSQATRNYYLGGILNYIAQRGIQSLPGTEIEIKKITNDFKLRNWKVDDYTGDAALEENVKAARNPRILHIATHGVFLKDVEYVTQGTNFENKKYIENPLLRSMLLFAGAENTIKGETSGILDKDDGILTAFEAMNLDLDNTELVVLSACETGLGEVRNGEGVYGLQRAFQVAGAKSLIMSLWSVSDQATQELMTSFYDKWLSGKSKREAFREAQQELKQKYPGFYYWGAFVMVGE